MRDILFQKSVRLSKIFVMNVVAGIGWALGVSVGFALLLTIITAILTMAGGLPVIGEWFRNLSQTIEIIQEARP